MTRRVSTCMYAVSKYIPSSMKSKYLYRNVSYLQEKKGSTMKETNKELNVMDEFQFCCMINGYEIPCTSCSFQWYQFNPKRRKRMYQTYRNNQYTDTNHTTWKKEIIEIQKAMELLEISYDTNVNIIQDLSKNQIKAAFRSKAIQWHPDCNKDTQAEEIFKQILDAYELLLAYALDSDE